MTTCRPSLINLPRELLLEVYICQNSINDVLAVAATCRFLRQIWVSNLRTISEPILSSQICCYNEALALYSVEGDFEYSWQDCDAQFPLTNVFSDGRLYNDFRSRLRHLLAIKRDVDLVLTHAEKHFAHRRRKAHCDAHPTYLLPHERERVAKGFYFLRRCVLAQSIPSVDTECENIMKGFCVDEIYILWEMMNWLCEELDYEPQEQLRIVEPDDPYDDVEMHVNIDWDGARDRIADAYCAKRDRGNDEYETRLYGPCDQCNKETCGSDFAVRNFWERRDA